MRRTLAPLLAGAALLLAGGAAQAETVWQGNSLRVTGAPGGPCTFTISSASIPDGRTQIFITARNTGSRTVSFALDLVLRGAGQSKSGTLGAAALRPGQGGTFTTGVTPFGGSLEGTTLEITARDCRAI